MKFGVMVDYYRSVGIDIGNDTKDTYWVESADVTFKDLPDRDASLEKANEIRNKQLK